MAHHHAPLKQRLLGIQEHSPFHSALLLVLLAIELHFHLESWTQMYIHGLMTESRSGSFLKKTETHTYTETRTMSSMFLEAREQATLVKEAAIGGNYGLTEEV